MNELATRQDTESGLSFQQVNILKTTIAKDCSDSQMGLFLAVCGRTGLDAFARQIYPVLRLNRKTGNKEMSIQVGIDGLRLIAQRSGEYEGQIPIQWCGQDGDWKDVWLSDEAPTAARAGVYRKGFREPLTRTVLYKSYCQKFDGKPMGLWLTMGEHMLGKCAEAAAIRAAFPQETSGIYTSDEMGQSSNVIEVEPVRGYTPPPIPSSPPHPMRTRFNQIMSETGHTPAQVKAICFPLGFPTDASKLTPEQADGLEAQLRDDADKEAITLGMADLDSPDERNHR